MQKFEKRELDLDVLIGALNEALPEPPNSAVPEREVRKKISQLLEDPNTETAPLTPEEAEAAQHAVKALRKKMSGLVDRIQLVRKQVDERVGNGFDLDITKRPNLRRAVQTVFGYNSDVVSYEMYKQAVEMKYSLEDEAVKDYEIE